MRPPASLCLSGRVSNLAMYVTGAPAGLRLTQLDTSHTGALSRLVTDMELAFFDRSETNEPEILGTLQAPELYGSRGTAGLWDGSELIAAALAFDELPHGGGLYLELFVHPDATQRTRIADRLLEAAETYGGTLPAPADDWVKSEEFRGDGDVGEAFRERGYEQHRVYLRMRLDFDEPPAVPTAPAGLAVRGMAEQSWPALHSAVNEAFQDHYDFHPRPLELFRRDLVNETTDMSAWRLVFDGTDCVGACLGSNRFAPHRLGYVEVLCVVRGYRGRGIARYLLRDAFARDAAAGFTGTSLHCDATNPTGAAALYERVGMRRDHAYNAWRTGLRVGTRFAQPHRR